MKVGVIVYHKNVDTLYPKRWIEEFKNSVEGQTYKEYTIYELNYGGGEQRIFPHSLFENIEMPTFVHGMNYLLDKCFKDGCAAVGNLNVDDSYDVRRLEKQLYYTRNGYDVVSSNFALLQDDRPVLVHKFDKLSIREELAHNHNILCHPAVVYSRRFIEKYKYIPEQIPYEDLKLWQRAMEGGMKFRIVPDVLCYHRLHNNSVCSSENR
jgi:hypothetical protein